MGRLIDLNHLDYLREVKAVRRIPGGILLSVDEEFVRIEILRPAVARIKISKAKRFDETPTFAAAPGRTRAPAFTVKQSAQLVTVKTDRMEIRIGRKPFAVDVYRDDGTTIFETLRANDGTPYFYGSLNDKFIVSRRCGNQDAFYGLGEKTRGFNKRGAEYMLWNNDILGLQAGAEHQMHPEGSPERNPTSNVFDPYYMSIPFFYHMPGDAQSQRLAGFFIDNGYKGYFDFCGGGQYRFQFCGGQYTEYIFAGPSMKEILADYCRVTGHMQAPPLWALGYHQCRWYAYNQETFLALGAEFRKRQIPCDTLWLDIDYMDEYRVFTWNKKRYPDSGRMFSTLRKQGFRTITIIDPGVKAEPGNPVFDEGCREDLFCRVDSGNFYIGQVWPGRTVFPDFVKAEARAWWGRLNARHVKSGLAGIWNDMNEPATGGVDVMPMRFDRNGANHPHERYHNQYGFLMAMGTHEGLLKAMPNLRTFILSRAGFAGIQRYAANWMGDNCSRWEHLAMSIPMAMNLGISGQPFVGADVGGFAEECRGELLARWTQYGALTPFFRNHYVNDKEQYPWSFGSSVERICREAIALRYRLLPYIYSAFVTSSETGAPVQRPLMYDFQDDPTAMDLDDQYLFGADLLIAPVCAAKQTRRPVYLPAGTWVDWHTGEVHSGPGFITAEAPLDRIPILARGGAVVPMLPEAPQTTDGLKPKALDLHVFIPREDGAFESMLQEDDGLTFAFRDGGYLRTRFLVKRSGSTVRLEAKSSGRGFPEFRRKQFRVVFHGAAVSNVRLNGAARVVDNGRCDVANAGEAMVLTMNVSEAL
jgi:alpha-glucosidase